MLHTPNSRVRPQLALLALLIACKGGEGKPVDMPGDEARGSTERETSPDTSGLSTLYAENAGFSLDLLRTVHDAQPGNQALSPWSLQVVLAQVHAGADEQTQAVIADTFGWSLEADALNNAFDAADLAVTAHNADGDTPVTVTSTNQIFVTTGYELGASWLDTLSSFYGTGVQQMDFAADPAGVAADINLWIADRTGDHIKDLISETVVSQSRMLLVNALYFNASWAVPFIESSTSDRPFVLEDGSEVEVPTLYGSVTVAGAQADGFFVADIPYSDEGLTMTIVLPDEGQFDSVLANLDQTTLQAAVDAEEYCNQCPVQLPKFEFKAEPDITAALKSMGMEDAFGGSYSGINPGLTLTAVEQQGFVAVNEEGTEAAAATVAEFADSASEPPFGPIEIDRPFIWLVREEPTGAVLFIGVVTDPR